MAGKEKNLDLTDVQQQQLFKSRSSTTDGIIIHLIIARRMDENKFAIMYSLDLSAAFDLVDLDFLLIRLKIMGVPITRRCYFFLEIWLRNKFFMYKQMIITQWCTT